MNNSQTDSKKTFSKIYQCYRTLMSQDVEEYETERSKLVFPILSLTLLTELCNYASKIFADESLVLNLTGDFIIVGDLHGHILDLFRILRQFGHPPKQNYVFLGDVVDRGEFSTETVILIFLMKCLYPNNVYIIRGNHEFRELWPTCGFLSELETLYNESQLSSSIFMKAFSFLPLAATINDKYLCVHGGIGPDMPTLEQLNHLHRPIMDFDFEPVLSIVWSDLSNSIKEFEPSTRGTGYLYGEPALSNYLTSQNLEVLIRGHECVVGGVEYSLRKKCITVFSASNYCGVTENDAGVLCVKSNEPPQSVKLKGLSYILRENASYLKSSSETTFLLSSKPISLNTEKKPFINGSKIAQNGIPKLNKNEQARHPELAQLGPPRQSQSNPQLGSPRMGTVKRSADRHKEQIPPYSPNRPPVNVPFNCASSQGFYANMRRPSRPKPKKRSSVQNMPTPKPYLQSLQDLPKIAPPIKMPPAPPNSQRKRRNNRLLLGESLSLSQPQFDDLGKNDGFDPSDVKTPLSPVTQKAQMFE